MEESGRPGGIRGSMFDRLRRVIKLLDLGDGKSVPCHHCQIPLGFETVTSDRIDPGNPYYNGPGGEVEGWVWPSCFDCNEARKDDITWRYTGRPRTRVTRVRSLTHAKRLIGHPRLGKKWSAKLANL